MSTLLQFEDCNFHDCTIHGIRFENVCETYIGELELHIDIDYIAEWQNCTNESADDVYFKIYKAVLTFTNACDVKIQLNEFNLYIDWIEKIVTQETPNQATYSRWLIHMHDTALSVELNASNMCVELIGQPHLVKMRQFLTSKEREV